MNHEEKHGMIKNRTTVLQGGFSMLKTLSDKRKYECQQCENEHTKRHKVVEIEMIIVHQHHPGTLASKGVAIL